MTLAVLALAAVPGAAQDTVTVSTGDGGGYAKHSGRILDYTGRRLQMLTDGDAPRTFPAEKVLHVQTPYGPDQVAADEAFDRGQFDRALALYRRAGTDESRRWVRRRIMARIVWCYRHLDQLDQAGEWFRLLIASDPSTQYFACVPLAWMPRQPAAAVEQAARQWIGDDQPAVVLLGASHLLTGDARSHAAAAEKLGQLTTASDRRVALLARAQTWRTATAGAQQQPLDAWSNTIGRMPEALTAGPYFVLGRAHMQREQWEQAALALMRVPILHAGHRRLGAQCLADAGRSLQRLGRTAEALRLYRELIADYPNTPPAAEARGRIQEMAKGN